MNKPELGDIPGALVRLGLEHGVPNKFTASEVASGCGMDPIFAGLYGLRAIGDVRAAVEREWPNMAVRYEQNKGATSYFVIFDPEEEASVQGGLEL